MSSKNKAQRDRQPWQLIMSSERLKNEEKLEKIKFEAKRLEEKAYKIE